MRALLLALALLLLPAPALADDNSHPAAPINAPALVEFGNLPGQWLYYQDGTLYYAVNPQTGQSIFVIPPSGVLPPGLYQIPGGAQYLVPVSIIGATVPVPGAQPNLWNPPSTIVTGPTQPSRYLPAPLAPNLWNPGQPLPDHADRDALPGPSTGASGPEPGERIAGSSPHQ